MAGRLGRRKAQGAAGFAVAEALELAQELDRVPLTATAPAVEPAQAVLPLAADPETKTVTPAAGRVRAGPGPLVASLLFRGEAHALVQG